MDGHTWVRFMKNLSGEASEPLSVRNDPAEDNSGILSQGVIGDLQEEL